MYNQNGWVKLHRKILENEIFRYDLTSFKVFITLLLLVDKDSGELTIGREQLGVWTGIKPITAYKSLLRLEKQGFVNRSSNSKYTKILICNWGKYQTDSNNFGNNEVTTEEQRSNNEVTHYKKKELRIKNKEKYIKKDLESLNEKVLEEIADKYNVSLQDIKNTKEELELYCQSTGKKYKDYEAALKNWVRRKLELGKIKKKPVNTMKEYQEIEESYDENKAKIASEIRKNLLKKLTV